MEPLKRTIIIIASHHIPTADLLTGTIKLLIIPFPLIAFLQPLPIEIQLHRIGIRLAVETALVPVAARAAVFGRKGELVPLFAGAAALFAAPAAGFGLRGVEVGDALVGRARGGFGGGGFERGVGLGGAGAGAAAAGVGERGVAAFGGAGAEGGLAEGGGGGGDGEVGCV